MNKGQILINSEAMQAMRPQIKEDGDDWAEREIEDVPYSPYPGRLSLAFTPWLKEPLRACTSESNVSLVVMLMAVQGGKTLCYDIATAYHSAHNASTILVISDTDDNAKDYAKTRLNLLFESNRSLRKLLPISHRKNTDLMHMLTNGTTWWTTGANNIKNLQRRSIRIVIGDEVWLWPEGHMTEAQARTTRFIGSSKVIFGSQAGIKGMEFDRFWMQTDRREWMWKCPECGEIQPWAMSMIDWDRDAHTEDGNPDYNKIRESAHYKCAKCDTTFSDTDRSRAILNAASFWQPMAAGEANKRGYHMTGIPYIPAADLAIEYVQARVKLKAGDPTAYQIFCQKRLAEFWDPVMGTSEEDTLEEADKDIFGEKSWERMSWIRVDRDRKRTFVDAPRKDGAGYIPLAFMTVDVQKDHLWYVIRAWNVDGSSMLIECGILATRDDVVQKQKAFNLPPHNVGIDSGDQTMSVYSFCHNHRFYAMKGHGVRSFHHKVNGVSVERPYSPTRAAYVAGGKIAKLITFSADAFKDIIYFAIRRTNKGESPKWEIPKNTPEAYKMHISAEKRVVDALGDYHWRNKGNVPNHCLDCETMNACLAMRKGVRMSGD